MLLTSDLSARVAIGDQSNREYFMSQASKAVIRGRATTRPWRVGVLIDVSDPVAVRATIDGLSRVWGGYFLPILDQSASTEIIKDLAGRFDLDSRPDRLHSYLVYSTFVAPHA